MHKLDPIQATKMTVNIWSKPQTDVCKGSGWGEEVPKVSPVPTSIHGPYTTSLAVCSVCAFSRQCVTDQVKNHLYLHGLCVFRIKRAAPV